MKLSKIVITGGPCGGKTSGLQWIEKAFSEKGYKVLFVPETATTLITGGISPSAVGSNAQFQKCILELQLKTEGVFALAAEKMKEERILIVCDRGAIDNKAYMTSAEYEEVLEYAGVSERKLLENYDAVFHLVTAAKGAEDFYTTLNNSARTETPSQAIALDEKVEKAWKGHPYRRLIDNSTDFQGKMERLVKEISVFLGEE